MNAPRNDLLDPTLPMPDVEVETPCFVIDEAAVEHNLKVTAELAGGVNRLSPHVKTHRSPWIVRMLVENGVSAFKTATPREVEMVLENGAKEAIWSYPTPGMAAIRRVIAAADTYPDAIVTGLVDSDLGLDTWLNELKSAKHPNVTLRVDIDPGMGRTGIPIGDSALALAARVHKAGIFAGWHCYDGHIQDADPAVRESRLLAILEQLNAMFVQAEKQGLSTDIVGGGSWTYPFWAKHTKARVSPGSWTYSSSQHQVDLAQYGWKVGAYVLSTVLSQHGETLTLDAGSKAIAPDIPMDKRFFGADQIVGMKEEHTIATAANMSPGDRVALVPRHACTTAYLYRRALVLTKSGKWEYRDQLGCER
ncbi:UNVERIFIED_ORG: D-serine deaminase-like pyridoxal phosphate-dependent protein [Burkholderia sp. CF145]